jgi:hypothetical protein
MVQPLHETWNLKCGYKLRVRSNYSLHTTHMALAVYVEAGGRVFPLQEDVASSYMWLIE